MSYNLNKLVGSFRHFSAEHLPKGHVAKRKAKRKAQRKARRVR